MRLGTVATGTGTTTAVVVTDDSYSMICGSGAAYADVRAVLAAGPIGVADTAAASRGPSRPLSEATLLRPVLDPGAVICLGLNYRSHAAEIGIDPPSNPTFFSKLSRALADPGRDVELPEASDRVDYEGEVALVIGQGGRNISVDDAWGAVAGLTLFNDVSMRDYQEQSSQWFAGKSWEASSPVGPFVATPDELEAVNSIELVVTVNGEERQRAVLDDLVFDIPTVVSKLSTIFTLRAGDVIALGTPAGIGELMEPKRYLRAGDSVEITATGLGTLTSRFMD